MVRIICEGKTDKTFLECLLKHMKIDFTDDNFTILGNKTSLLNYDHDKYESLKKQVEFGKIKKLLFVVDSDYVETDRTHGGYSNTESCIADTISKLSLTHVSDSYIMCDPTTKEGYLESLILASIPDEHKECIHTFLSCSETTDKHHHKYIINSIYNVYYPKTGYDFNDQNFTVLKDKLRKLFL